MHINQRTKGYEHCIAEAMLLDMSYAWASHAYYTPDVKGGIDPETMEPLNAIEMGERINDFYSIFKDSSYKVRGNQALQYLKDYGPKP